VLAAVLLGLLVGWLNGFLTLRFNLNSLIVTLGVGTFLQGLVHWASKSTTISGLAPELVQGVIIGRIAGIPLAFYYALLLCLILWYVFQYTALGRHFLFVGRNREVAKLSGIDVSRVRWLGMIISSLFGALAGIIYTGTRGAADPTSGLSFMLPAFAAAFLGATAIYPGRFNPVGTIVSVYFLVTGITGLLLMGVAPFVQDLFYGGALIVAVTLSQALKRA
jgi:ribose transport system permease protein